MIQKALLACSLLTLVACSTPDEPLTERQGAVVTTGQCSSNPWLTSENNMAPPGAGALLWTTTGAGNSGCYSLSADRDHSTTSVGWSFYSVAASYHLFLCIAPSISTWTSEWEPCTDGQSARIDGPAWSWGITSHPTFGAAIVTTNYMPAPPICSNAVGLGSATDCHLTGDSGFPAMIVKDLNGLTLTKPFSNGDAGGPCTVVISGVSVESVPRCPVSYSIDGTGANATVQTW